jgi:hypothetical protein
MEHRRKKKPDIDPHAPGLGVSVAETLADLNWDDLPPDLVRNLKMFVLDNLGVLGGAARAPGIAELNAATPAPTLVRRARWRAIERVRR